MVKSGISCKGRIDYHYLHFLQTARRETSFLWWSGYSGGVGFDDSRSGFNGESNKSEGFHDVDIYTACYIQKKFSILCGQPPYLMKFPRVTITTPKILKANDKVRTAT